MDKSRRKVDSRSVMLQCSVPILISILPEKACNFQSNLLEQVRGKKGKNWSLIVLLKKPQTLYNFSRCYCKIVLYWYVDSLACRLRNYAK